jgi:hypothetical protein
MEVNNVQARWAGVMRNHNASGLTVRDFCETNNINTKTFYGWRKRIGVSKNTTTGFMRLMPPLAAKAIEVRIKTPNGYHVDIEHTDSLKNIFEMLRAL